MKQIEVLWLVEHIAREMDVACAVKCLAKTRYSLNINIQHIFLHANRVMKEFSPAVVVLPFFYRASDLAVADYTSIWPSATYFNLACEQIHYRAHVTIKAPGDVFAKQSVIHHAWGDFYRDYLLENGVPSEHIFLNGNPAYQLYQRPYNEYFKQRDWLAEEYGLDGSSRWVFIPENYRWAFVSESKIKRWTNEGSDLGELMKMRKFCQESLVHLLQWCNEAGKNKGVEIIFRPRPGTNSQLIQKFFDQYVGRRSSNLHFIKSESVRDWILASNVVISSYSTSLIEAAVANKPIYMAEPIRIPESLYCDWYEHVSRIYSGSQFEQICLGENDSEVRKLSLWAQDEMLANGDPIERLVDFLGRLVERVNSGNAGAGRAGHSGSISVKIRSLRTRGRRRFRHLIEQLKAIFPSLLRALKTEPQGHFRSMKSNVAPANTGKDRQSSRRFVHLARSLFVRIALAFNENLYFNTVTHENDVFTETEVEKRTEAWYEILGRQRSSKEDVVIGRPVNRPANRRRSSGRVP